MRRLLIAFGLSLVMSMLALCQTPHRVAILAGKLIDGKSDKPLENVLIVIEGDKIASVVAGGSAPAGVEVIDLSKATVLPGFIDTHTHVLLQGDITAEEYDAQLLKESIPYRAILAARNAQIALSHGFNPGEEDILIEAHKTLSGFFPQLLTVIVPRHPDRGAAIARTIATAGLTPALRSREDLPTAATDVYVADTMGELGLFYRFAPIVFMGGSLVEHGGQNPIEAVKLGASIVHGPHVFNFADVYEALDGAGGARKADTQEALVKHLGQLLADPAARDSTAAASARVVGQLGGALERTLAALEPYLLQLRLEMGAANA